MANDAVRLKTAVHFGKVDRPLPLMNLHGISAAKSDVRTSFTGEVNEISFSAGAASGTRFGSRDFGVIVRPEVE